MYEQFYRFSAKPFSLLPDSDFLYRSKGHRLALSLLEYGLGAQTGFTVISGEIGSGKTTLLQYLLKHSDPTHTIGYITNTVELNKDLMRWILYAFGIQTQLKEERDAYKIFVDFVKLKYSEGRDCVLIIDEAQLLAPNTLESIRLLSNLNVGRDHILKILLVGQPELLQTLARPDLVQFAQRVSANFHLKPLGLIETREYIRTRLRIAGGVETLFDEMACDLIFIFSGGVPRQINILCDTALVYGYADGRHSIELDTALGMLRDRSDGRHFGSVAVPENLDRAAAENLIWKAREKEIAQAGEVGSSRALSPPNTQDEAVGEPLPAPTQREYRSMRDTLPGRTPLPTPPLDDKKIENAAANRSTHPILRVGQTDLDRGWPPANSSTDAQNPGTSSGIQKSAAVHRVQDPSMDAQPTLFDIRALDDRRLHGFGEPERPAPAGHEMGSRLSKPFEVLPLFDEANRPTHSATRPIKPGIVLRPIMDAAPRQTRIRRRAFWLVVFALLIVGIVVLGTRGLALISKAFAACP